MRQAAHTDQCDQLTMLAAEPVIGPIHMHRPALGVARGTQIDFAQIGQGQSGGLVGDTIAMQTERRAIWRQLRKAATRR